MSVVAQVKNGQIVDNANKTTSTETAAKEKSSTLDKQAFLQLLVAQMKYQDPLEPTDNTEYISQLATFSSLEQMQNMSATLELQRGSSLVGKEVYLETQNTSTGDTNSVTGVVDYVTFENNKCFVSIDGTLYPLEDVKSVYDPTYTEAYEKAYNFTVALNKLPNASKLTIGYQSDVEALQKTYESMTDYQKSFLTADNKQKIEELISVMNALKEAKEKADKEDEANVKESETAEEKAEDTAEETVPVENKEDETDSTEETTDSEAATEAASESAKESGSSEDDTASGETEGDE
jgi:flagellar basal-body rod modification protein FlgD